MTAVDLEKLRAPFSADELEWKVQRCGLKGTDPWAIVVPYVDARAIMKRLDDVAGPENWQSRLVPTSHGMLCELSLRLGGEWITKMDGADETDYEPFKGGISKALVRAAVHWGVGRDLYNLPNMFARFVPKTTTGAQFVKIEGKDFWWVPNSKPFEKTELVDDVTATLAPQAAAPAAQAAPPARAPSAPLPGAAQAATPAARPQTAPVAQGPRPAPRPSALATVPEGRPIAASPGDAVVPFGHNQGKRLDALSDQELAGLADFYARVPEPKGKAKLFKREFDKYMTSRSRAS